MNIQEYISSGILESYVLGTATLEEKKEVENNARLYPEIKSELEEIEKSLNDYAISHSIAPPSYLKNKILATISKKTTFSEAANPPVTRNINSVIESKASTSYWSIAASFLFIVSTSFAIYFGVRNKKMDGDMDSMAKVNTTLADSIKSLSTNISQMQNDLSILKDPMYKIVDLKGLKVAPESKALVCWRPTDKAVYVEIEKLPPPPQGMQYQLWAIVDGQPVSEGMMTMGNGLHRMSDVENAQAFAVTLEKTGGSPTPKGDMYVMGTI